MVRVRVTLGYTMAMCLVLQHQVSPVFRSLVSVDSNTWKCCSSALCYCQCKPKSKKEGRPGNKATQILPNSEDEYKYSETIVCQPEDADT